jgi:hypothetical protein
MYEEFTPTGNQSQFSIGEGNGKVIESISTDGFTVTVVTSRETDFYDGYTFGVYNTQNYDVATSKPITVFSPSQFSYLEDYAVSIVSTTDGTGLVTVVTEDPHGYTNGDTVDITDNVSYSVQDVVTVIDTTTFTLPQELGADYTSGVTAISSSVLSKLTETLGYIFRTGESVPDIITPRPLSINELITSEGTTKYALRQMSHSEFDSMGYQLSSGRPYSYTYVPSAPFGVIKFDRTFGGTYPFTIKYEQAILSYDLNSEVISVAGYEGYLQYALAEVVGPAYGKDVSRITMITKGYRDRLLTNNAINLQTVAYSDSPLTHQDRYDSVNDRWY